MRILRPLVLAATGVVLLSACGDTKSDADGSEAEVRTIEVEMVDNAFEPETLDVTRGQTVRFEFTNTGAVAHDAFIGDHEAQADHEAEMREADGNEHGGGHGEDAEGAITVEPGDTGGLTYTFDEAGTIEVGCHQEGHYEADMKITVEVT